MVDKFGGTSIGTVASMISGNTNDGVWQATITVPQYTGPQWFVSQVGLEDHAGNYVNYLSPGYSTDSFDFALSGLGYFGSDPSSSPSATNVGVSDTTRRPWLRREHPARWCSRRPWLTSRRRAKRST